MINRNKFKPSVYQLKQPENIGYPIGIAGTNGFKDHHYELLKNKEITIATDNDKSGIDFREKMIKYCIAKLLIQPKWIDYTKYDNINDINELIANK